MSVKNVKDRKEPTRGQVAAPLAGDTGRIIRLFLLCSVAAFLLGAILVPDRAQMFSGLRAIMLYPAQITKDYFFIGSISGTLLNMALVGAVCVGMLFLPGAVTKGSTVAAFFLTMGFSTWGINFLNIWPFFLGVFLHSVARQKPFAAFTDLAMFSTALCPLISELLLRYPNSGSEMHSITVRGGLLALGVGALIGFLTPAMAGHSPNLHKGYDLYSAALPGGLLGIFMVAALYKTAGVELPEIGGTLGDSHPVFFCVFLGLFFVGCFVAGFFLNGKSVRGYIALLHDTGHKVDFTAKYGPGLALMNMGVYGLFIMLYYIVIRAPMNGVTFGVVFCMVCFGAAGAHPGNVWPIMIGYILVSFLGVNAINAQAIIAGLCFASGLAPIAGAYGWWAGVIAGAAHYTLVTSIPAMHGGFCLYNGGFTSLLVAIIIVPQLEMFCKTREEWAALQPKDSKDELPDKTPDKALDKALDKDKKA